jgi:hypothetical protein
MSLKTLHDSFGWALGMLVTTLLLSGCGAESSAADGGLDGDDGQDGSVTCQALPLTPGPAEAFVGTPAVIPGEAGFTSAWIQDGDPFAEPPVAAQLHLQWHRADGSVRLEATRPFLALGAAVELAQVGGLTAVVVEVLESTEDIVYLPWLQWFDSSGEAEVAPVALSALQATSALSLAVDGDRLALAWSELPSPPPDEAPEQHRIRTAVFEGGGRSPVASTSLAAAEGSSQRDPALAVAGALRGLVFREALGVPGISFQALDAQGGAVGAPVPLSFEGAGGYGVPGLAAHPEGGFLAAVMLAGPTTEADPFVRQTSVAAVHLDAHGAPGAPVVLDALEAEAFGESLGFVRAVADPRGFAVGYAARQRERGSWRLARVGLDGAPGDLVDLTAFRAGLPAFSLAPGWMAFGDARGDDPRPRPYAQPLCASGYQPPALPGPCPEAVTRRLTRSPAETAFPRALATEDGSFLVFYESNGLWALGLDAAGQALGDPVQFADIVGGPLATPMALSGGRVAVAWNDNIFGEDGLLVWHTFFRTFLPGGEPATPTVDLGTLVASDMDLRPIPEGFLLAMAIEDEEQGLPRDYLLLVLDPSGQELRRQALTATDRPGSVTLAEAPAGGLAMVWQEQDESFARRMYFQRLDSTGLPQGAPREIQLPAAYPPDMFSPHALVPYAQEFALAWASYPAGKGVIVLDLLDAAGAVTAGPTVLVQDAVASYQHPRLAPFRGGLAVSWQACTDTPLFEQWSGFGVTVVDVEAGDFASSLLDDRGVQQGMLCGVPAHSLLVRGDALEVVFQDMRDEWAAPGTASSEVYLGQAPCPP